MWIDDQVLKACAEDICIKIWVPSHPVVVLGRSNRLASEVNDDHCRELGVPVVKRLGGGGTVLLHDGCLVVSCGLWVSDYYKNDQYFRKLNQSVIGVLKAQVPHADFGQRGHSDIVYQDRKFVGTSLFRSRNYLLYQASILIDPKIEQIETVLRHPSAEPDYRKGRGHRDFLVGLRDFSNLTPQEWAPIFDEQLRVNIVAEMKEDLLPAQIQQINHVLSRVGEVTDLDFPVTQSQ